MTSPNLEPVRNALLSPVEAPPDGFDPAMAGDDRFGPDGDAPPAMPDDCPVIPVGTEDGIYYFLTALGEMRGLTCDKVANKHIVGMFAPDSKYLLRTWPRTKKVTEENEHGEEIERTIVTGWRNDDVAMLLMDVAALRGVWNAREKVRGRGAWLHDDGSLILHAGNHVLMNGRWCRPGMYDGMVYPTAPPIPKPMADTIARGIDIAPGLIGQLRMRGIEIAEDASPAQVYFETLKTWNWERPQIDPRLLLGWDGAAMLGGALDYRPVAWITGGKATGKSSLQKIKGWLFDGGILQSPDASEAAVRQVLGQQSLPVAIDEAEAEADSRKVLALVKLARLAASSQGNILRGGQDHKGHEFQATSCFLFSSILVPPIPPQDKSRMAMLELGELPAGAREPRFDKREIMAIGQWMRARLAERWRLWPRVLEAYSDALLDFGDQGGRAADQFGTLLAAAHVLLDDDMPDDQSLLEWGMMLGRERLAETANLDDNPALCMAHLCTTPVQLAGHGNQRLVSDWLLQATEPMPAGAGADMLDETRGRRRTANDALAKVGLAAIIGKARKREAGDERPQPVPGRDYLAIAVNHQGLARLFEGSDWARGVWTQAAKRVRGAIPGETQRIGGVSTKCTLVPMDVLIERDAEGAEAMAMADADR